MRYEIDENERPVGYINLVIGWKSETIQFRIPWFQAVEPDFEDMADLVFRNFETSADLYFWGERRHGMSQMQINDLPPYKRPTSDFLPGSNNSIPAHAYIQAVYEYIINPEEEKDEVQAE